MTLLSEKKMVESGPDYAGYYKQRVIDLFMQNESSPLPSQMSQSRTRSSKADDEYGDVANDVHQDMEINVNSDSSVLFSYELGEDLTDFDKDMLKAILHECAIVLNQEVEEVIENFIRLNCSHSDLDKKPKTTSSIGVCIVDKDQKSTFKKQKSALQPIDVPTDTYSSLLSGQNHPSSFQRTSMESEASIDDHTLNLSAKLLYMEEQLDELVDILMSKCRPMTHPEKVQLRWYIEQMPSEALHRVVGILGKRNPSVSKSREEINVDLENEDDVTLWRLYYYVRAVSRASL